MFAEFELTLVGDVTVSGIVALTMWAIPPWIVVIAGGVVASGVAALGFPL